MGAQAVLQRLKEEKEQLGVLYLRPEQQLCDQLNAVVAKLKRTPGMKKLSVNKFATALIEESLAELLKGDGRLARIASRATSNKS